MWCGVGARADGAWVWWWSTELLLELRWCCLQGQAGGSARWPSSRRSPAARVRACTRRSHPSCAPHKCVDLVELLRPPPELYILMSARAAARCCLRLPLPALARTSRAAATHDLEKIPVPTLR
ncbi:hypothetical protein B0J12DRAFT_238067 [Macrophomina phaseolina]|uniref:Secreted protein n=1 Tax=Macrophomina phaseolina TaxID=35725 RepID=A0ABQ8GQH6_9PEZI|nr:hypothetical protein B0J12DRAFT_238067 [Macrophomina phaseolina]